MRRVIILSNKRVLLLGVYGMELVRVWRHLIKNVLASGKSYANVMLCREDTRPQVAKAAKVLGVKISFSDF